MREKTTMPERIKDLNFNCGMATSTFQREEFAFLDSESNDAPVDGNMPTTRDVSDVPVNYDDPCYNDCIPFFTE